MSTVAYAITVTGDDWGSDNVRLRKFVKALSDTIENTPGELAALTVTETTDRYRQKKAVAKLRIKRLSVGASALLPK